MKKQIIPCLWYDREAEEAVNFYISVFPNSSIGKVSRYSDEAASQMGMPQGAVLSISFSLGGNQYTALNGGPMFRFNEAVSFQIFCKDQQEIDYYWNRLTEGGEPSMCGWLKDRYGLSWQIVPESLEEMLSNPKTAATVSAALMKMTKLDLAALEQAAAQATAV